MAEDQDSTSSDSVDAYSDRFDSFKALYSDKVQVPVPDAPRYDNIHKFETVVLKGVVVQPNTGQVEQATTKEMPRRFLPHQEMISGGSSERRQRYLKKNVVSRMQKVLGPLSVLYQYMENRTRVKIYTRNAIGIRGHVEAYIAAFDKHWNLALEDCLEIWSRKVKRKAPALGDSMVEKNFSSDLSPKVIVKKRTKKMETLERHVPQLLLRGEQVVLITKMEE